MKYLVVFSAIFFLGMTTMPLFAGGKSDVSLESAKKKYPETAYISAIGTGRDRASAESNAKLALSQILGESISAEQVTTHYVDSTGKEAASIASVVNEKAMFEHITGIVIKETVTDKKTGTTHALAVLDRKEAGNFYFAKVNQANTQIASLIAKATAGKGTIDSLGYLNSAMELAVDTAYNFDLLSVISPAQGRLAAVSYQSPQMVSAKRTELASALRVWVRVLNNRNADDEQCNRVRAAFASRLTALGATVVPETDATATHSVAAELVFTPAEAPDPAYQFVRYTLSATLSEFSTNKSVPYSLSGREGHVSELQAKNRAIIKIENDITENYLSAW